jgi:hypothetical protein
VVISVYFLSNRSSVSSVPISTAEQKRINEADGMPCTVDGNGVYEYKNKSCIPTSCKTGYTQYNNACYTDEWWPHSYTKGSYGANLKFLTNDGATTDRKECMEKCHNHDECGVYSHDNNSSCSLYKIEPAFTENPSEFMVKTENWMAPRGNSGFGFI